MKKSWNIKIAGRKNVWTKNWMYEKIDWRKNAERKNNETKKKIRTRN